MNSTFFICIRTANVGIKELALFFKFMLIVCIISCLLILYEYSKEDNICKNFLFILYPVFYTVTKYRRGIHRCAVLPVAVAQLTVHSHTISLGCQRRNFAQLSYHEKNCHNFKWSLSEESLYVI